MSDLKCVKCDNHLSVSPIKYFEGQYYCGRCSCDQGSTVTIYEELARRSGLFFPCRYQDNGCSEMLQFSEVKEHEVNCEKKPMYCPIKNCSHQILLGHASSHMEKYHSGIFTTSMFEIDVQEKGVIQKLFILNEYLFLVTINNGYYDNADTTLGMNIQYLSSTRKQCSKCKATFRSIDLHKDFSMWMEGNTFCDNNDKSYNFIVNQHMLEYVTENTNSVKLLIEISLEENSKITENVKKSLECPICNNFLQEPIMQCSSGHSFCKNCTGIMRKCPFCRQSFSNRLTRNFALESISKEIICPCRNASLGCIFIGMYDEMKQHNETCDFIECPVKINEECFTVLHFDEVYQHCKKEHNIFSNPLTNVYVDLSKNIAKPSVRLIEAHGKIFKFYRVYSENSFKYIMMYVGPAEEANMYSFNFELVNKCEDKTLKICENVVPFINEKKIQLENCLNLQKEGFTDYLDRGCLYCNVSIDLKTNVKAEKV